MDGHVVPPFGFGAAGGVGRIAGVLHCRALPPGDPVMSIVVEEVVPGKVAGA